MTKHLILTLLLLACTPKPSKPEDIKVSADEPVAAELTDEGTRVKINPLKFPGCVGYKVTFKEVYYGLFQAEDTINLPSVTLAEKAVLKIVCTDLAAHDGAERSFVISRP